MQSTNTVQIPNQTPGTAVIVVNQQGRRTGPLYMSRGTTCCDGCRVTTCLFTVILTFGLMFSIMSLAYIPFTYFTLLGLPVGLYLIGLFIYLYKKAKREFDALPHDHPDRLKYSGLNITHLPINLNPPSNQTAVPPNPEPQVPPNPGQNYVFPQGPNPPGQGPLAPPQGLSASPPGYTPTQEPSVPCPPPQGYYPPPAKYDDDPPPYSAIYN